jgi:ABC-2 type transport system permease protein
VTASLVALVRKELIQAFRDRRMLFMLLMVPVVQVVIFGYAANLEFNHARTVLVDDDRSTESRDFAAGLAAEGTFEVQRARSDDEALRAMQLGEAHVAVIIPRRFGEHLASGLPAEVQVLVDGTEPTRAVGAAAAVQAFVAGRGARTIAVQAASAGAPPMPRITVQPRLLYNPSLKSRLFMVPGTAASILLIVTTIVTAMGLARERELGTMEQLLVTPIHPITLMLGKTVPYALFGIVDEALILVVGNVLFDVPLRGSFLLVFAGTVAYLVATLSMGLLISTFARTQQQAIMGGFFFLLPALLLSGFITPIDAMPWWIRPITYLIPVRYFIEIIRGTLLRGATFADLGPTLAALVALGISFLLLAAWRFQRTIA